MNDRRFLQFESDMAIVRIMLKSDIIKHSEFDRIKSSLMMKYIPEMHCLLPSARVDNNSKKSVHIRRGNI